MPVLALLMRLLLPRAPAASLSPLHCRLKTLGAAECQAADCWILSRMACGDSLAALESRRYVRAQGGEGKGRGGGWRGSQRSGPGPWGRLRQLSGCNCCYHQERVHRGPAAKALELDSFCRECAFCWRILPALRSGFGKQRLVFAKLAHRTMLFLSRRLERLRVY